MAAQFASAKPTADIFSFASLPDFISQIAEETKKAAEEAKKAEQERQFQKTLVELQARADQEHAKWVQIVQEEMEKKRIENHLKALLGGRFATQG